VAIAVETWRLQVVVAAACPRGVQRFLMRMSDVRVEQPLDRDERRPHRARLGGAPGQV